MFSSFHNEGKLGRTTSRFVCTIGGEFRLQVAHASNMPNRGVYIGADGGTNGCAPCAGFEHHIV